MFAYWSMVSFVYASNFFSKRKELNAFADKLQEHVDVEHQYLLVGEITGAWSGNQGWGSFDYSLKLRRIISAVRAGKVRVENMRGEKVSMATNVYVEDVIKVLREGSI